MVSSYSPLNDEEGEGLRTLGGILQPPSNFQLFFPPTAKARGRRKEVDRTRYSEMHGKSAGCASSACNSPLDQRRRGGEEEEMARKPSFPKDIKREERRGWRCRTAV